MVIFQSFFLILKFTWKSSRKRFCKYKYLLAETT